MAPSSRKRKASELWALPDLNGNPIATKGRRKTKKPQSVENTATAPDNGYSVEVDPPSDDADRAAITLWDEINWTTHYAVHPSHWRDIKSYKNFIRGFPLTMPHSVTSANIS